MKLSKILCCVGVCASLFLGVVRADAELAKLPSLLYEDYWISYPTFVLDVTNDGKSAADFIDTAEYLIHKLVPSLKQLENKLNTVTQKYDENTAAVKIYYDEFLPLCYAKIEITKPIKPKTNRYLVISLFVSAGESLKKQSKPQ